MSDLVLPSFAMDCRDWLVVTPAQAGLPEEVDGTPVLAVLSTVVIDDAGFRPASGVLTIGLLDEHSPRTRPVAPGSVAGEILDEASDDARSYVMPAPNDHLALLAEFSLSQGNHPEVVDRIEALMASFRWAA
jgi:hypothetical protein